MPTTELPCSDLGQGINILDLLMRTGLIPSKGEGRRLISQGGIYIGDSKVESIDLMITSDHFVNNELVIRKGKKVYHKIMLV